MSNFTESELIPAAVKIILKETNGIETKDLIIELRNLMIPSGEDLERLSNRRCIYETRDIECPSYPTVKNAKNYRTSSSYNK